MTFSSVAILGLCLILAAKCAPSASSYKSVDCSDPANQVILHPHPTSCSHYLQCNHGSPLERPCAPGTEFSPSIGVCVHPWQSDCTSEDTVEEEEPEEAEAPEVEDSEELQTETPEESQEKDSEEPEVELEEEEIEETTPHASLEDDVDDQNDQKVVPEPESDETVVPSSEELDRAASEELEPEVISPAVACQSRSDSFFLAENPADCTSYVICNFGQALLRSCSEGEFFDPSISTCTVDSSHCA